ncbi:MAG: 2-C-methyl-D-erythritol 4-phosphate cytidylyltransferase [Alphaproteobacteria bacterium]|nr:2-C-methyl-D-erythritol 4-phosphate cytidylyltransferase [Alphaproteobacteria bacterium]
MKTNNIAIIFAGGIGQRLNSDKNATPKQFLKVYNKPIIIYTLELFQQNENIDKIYISIVASHLDYMKELVEYYHLTKVAGITVGGATGQDSIYKALKMAAQENSDDSIVLIHDGVRPNITQEVINLNIQNAREHGTSITSTPAFETILFSEDGITPKSVPYRRQTFAAQAPQTFKLGEIVSAHEQERQTNPDYIDIIDSCTLFTKQGKPTHMIRGNFGNIKITTIEDLYVLRALITCKEDMNAFGLKK